FVKDEIEKKGVHLIFETQATHIHKLDDGSLRLDLTNGEPTPRGTPALRHQETNAATSFLCGTRDGQPAPLTWRGNAGMINRMLEPTLENRARLANYFRILRPRNIFAPYWMDAHPDHTAATQLAEAARFWSKLTRTETPDQPDLIGTPYHPPRIYHYFCVHLRLSVRPDFILDISQQWDAKRNAMRSYYSQFIDGRPTQSPTLFEQFEIDAAYWGKMIGVAHGEPFASKEPLGLNSLSSLV
ncbi:MAG: hypothetical protein AAFP90_18670, partial [Planctomycetota bacterium]